MNELPRQKLREIVARHGRAVAGDRRRCEGLLRDYCGGHRREVSALVAALEEHVPSDLLDAPAATPRGVLLARLARRLSDHLALSETAAEWSVNSWALALGVVSDEELKAHEQRTDAPAQTAADAPRGQQAAPRAQQAASSGRPAPGGRPAAPSGQIAQREQTAARGRVARAGPVVPARAASGASDVSAVLVVSARGGGDYASIGEAISRAAPGSRLLVRPGLYEEGLVLDRELEIVGDGPAGEIVVSSAAASCVVLRAARARVAGLTLRGEAGAGGVGFFAVDVPQGRLLLEDCDISSRTLSCVAVHGDGTEAALRRCRVHDGADSGVYFFDGARGTLEDCAVYANANVGVAITARAEPTVRGGEIYGGANAGVAVWGGGVGTLEGCRVAGNRLAGVGVGEGGRLTARSCRIHEGDNSGVFVHHGGDVTLDACHVYGHREAEVAVESRGQLTALRCDIRRGRDSGVVVRGGGQAMLRECVVAGHAGAGVSVGDGSLAAVLGCQVTGNGLVGVRVAGGGAARVAASDLTGNRLAPWDAEAGAFVEGGGNKEEE